ncbi:MAG: hypothetical protein AAFQ09_11765 [Pseudomonadota bacterium]
MSDILPRYITPKALAEKLGASPRFVSDTVRELGCFCQIGRRMVMLDRHVDEFMEAMECRSKSRSATKSGTTAGRLPEGDYAALREQRTKGLQKGLRPKSKRKLGKVISMDPGQC